MSMNAIRTVGLDFGTHQTKICVEEREGNAMSYQFFPFCNLLGEQRFTLPSVIQIRPDGTLRYGYAEHVKGEELVKNFKQAVFALDTDLNAEDCNTYFAVWYLAYVLFLMEEKWGQEFAVQMGCPTDGGHLEQQQHKAVSLLLSAYKLVEEEFHNDLQAFLNTDWVALMERTALVPFSDEAQRNYFIDVYPEAYACLRPLVVQKKVPYGLALLIDIGGGTTDISFFTVVGNNQEGRNLVVYNYQSVPKGLNALVDSWRIPKSQRDANIREIHLRAEKVEGLTNDIANKCRGLRGRLLKHFSEKCGSMETQRLTRQLADRPLIYIGGGSTFGTLRKAYGDFNQISAMDASAWRTANVKGMDEIENQKLCPILSTAYGLCLTDIDDKIQCTSVENLFDNLVSMIRQGGTDSNPLSGNTYSDWSALK